MWCPGRCCRRAGLGSLPSPFLLCYCLLAGPLGCFPSAGRPPSLVAATFPRKLNSDSKVTKEPNPIGEAMVSLMLETWQRGDRPKHQNNAESWILVVWGWLASSLLPSAGYKFGHSESNVKRKGHSVGYR
ncbi:hypothetical protein C2845_PM01G14710 [Panicum miliaceum]|uniref:Secreted protein n=1 Tax=Panicum miliaceum TaxID=4540 RepID=A0A3L6TSV0_PANMI|nr:hypothetical protein C2845_PM01G14710 [Panicum miliaceum]